MKKMFAITMLMFVFFGLVTVNPATAGTPVSCSIRQTIAESVTYPEAVLGKDANETVDVLFKLTDEGKVEVRKLTSGNKELLKYVTEQISKIQVTDAHDLNNTYYKITLTFQAP
jgi:hypothetical protein